MKSWRSGFIKCRSLDGPWGSHHDEARREKCNTSEAETEEGDGEAGAAVERCLACACLFPNIFNARADIRESRQATAELRAAHDMFFRGGLSMMVATVPKGIGSLLEGKIVKAGTRFGVKSDRSCPD